jgi:two-component system, chemotaxis family, protein-glutamate methylesterase/glutaminase
MEPADFRVVGIGASAGGIDALLKVLGPIPAEFPHAICVVLHIAATGSTALAQILDRRCELPVRSAEDGLELEAGHVYVGVPDRHLLVSDGRLELNRGPKENGVRPAVDALLRSLALTHGENAVAVVLSGALGDGSDGARLVALAGGRVIVQDPEDALVASMPQRAIALVGEAAEVLPAEMIGPALGALGSPRREHKEEVLHVHRPDMQARDSRRPAGPATGFTCPECGGALWEVNEGNVVRYRCRIGHAFSEDALITEQGSALEAALWSALETLEERAELLRKVSDSQRSERPSVGERFRRAAEDADARADLIRRALAPDSDTADALAPEGA